MYMCGTGHAGIETTNGAQDIDALVRLWTGEVLQDWGVEYGFLVWPWIAPRVSRTGIPRRGGEDLIIAQCTLVDDGVVGFVIGTSS